MAKAKLFKTGGGQAIRQEGADVDVRQDPFTGSWAFGDNCFMGLVLRMGAPVDPPTILRPNARSLTSRRFADRRRQVTNRSGGHAWERAIPRRGRPVQECMGSIYTCAVILYIFLIITLGQSDDQRLQVEGIEKVLDQS